MDEENCSEWTELHHFSLVLNEEKSLFLYKTFQKLSSSIFFFLAVMLRLLFCHCYMQDGLLLKNKLDLGTIIAA